MDGDSAIPPYAWIAWQLRDAIRAGVRGLGESMPSESELAELYGVSRMTAGKCWGLLAAEGLIRRRRGSGSVVARQISWEQIPARPGTIISVRLPTASERAAAGAQMRPWHKSRLEAGQVQLGSQHYVRLAGTRPRNSLGGRLS